jgi:hypothetical protein
MSVEYPRSAMGRVAATTRRNQLTTDPDTDAPPL